MKIRTEHILSLAAIGGLVYFLTKKKEITIEKPPEIPAVPEKPKEVISPGLQKPPSGYSVYNLQRGETLYSVAQKLLGDGSRWKEIIVARFGRPVSEEEARNLQISEVLYVPQAGGVTQVQPQQPKVSDVDVKIQIVKEIKDVSGYYYTNNPPWYREKLIENLVAKYGEQYRAYISEQVYTILRDIKTIGYIDSSGNFVAYQTAPTISSQSPTVLPAPTPAPTPAPIPTTFPKVVTAQSWGARFRRRPYLSAQLVGSVRGGTRFTVVGVVKGDTYEGENRWWQVSDGTYTWVGNTIEKP